MEREIINGKKYFWCTMTLDDLDEFLAFGGNLFAFRYHGADYYVEGACFDIEEKGRIGSYSICDETKELPGSRQAKNPDEFKALPFIEGKNILEVFDELRFFDP